MKKKIFLVLVMFVGAFPIIGNKFVEEYLNERVTTLDSKGLYLSASESDATYLNTTNHYEFVIKDEKAFLSHFQKYSNKQIPPYVNFTIEGTLVGVDVTYSNFLFSKAIAIDIYPLKLSKDTSEYIKKDDIDLYNYLSKFLQKRGILYHINYNIVSKDFEGYIKDIKEIYSLKDGAKLSFTLTKALFSGNGDLAAPSRLDASIEHIDMSLQDNENKILFNCLNFTTKSNFESAVTYLSSAKFKSVALNIVENDENLTIHTHDVKVNISSNIENQKVQLKSKTSIKDLSIESKVEKLLIEELQYVIAVKGVDKKYFEKLKILDSYANITPSQQQKMMETTIAIFSKGLTISIPQFDMKNMTLKNEKLNGFKIKADLKIKEDKNLYPKIKISSLLIIQDIDMSVDINLSNEIYAKIMSGVPMTGVLARYAKKGAKSVLYSVSYIDGSLKINGKALK